MSVSPTSAPPPSGSSPMSLIFSVSTGRIVCVICSFSASSVLYFSVSLVLCSSETRPCIARRDASVSIREISSRRAPYVVVNFRSFLASLSRCVFLTLRKLARLGKLTSAYRWRRRPDGESASGSYAYPCVISLSTTRRPEVRLSSFWRNCSSFALSWDLVSPPSSL